MHLLPIARLASFAVKILNRPWVDLLLSRGNLAFGMRDPHPFVVDGRAVDGGECRDKDCCPMAHGEQHRRP